MGEKETDHSNQSRISRRSFLKTMPVLSVGAVMIAREVLNPPRKDPLEFEEIDAITKAELLEYSPLTVFHNVMNSSSRFGTALATASSYMDVDVVEFDGDIFASHDPYREIPLIEKLLPFIISGPFKPKFEDIAAIAADKGRALYLDLKNINSKNFLRVREILEEYGLEESSLFNSKNWRLLQEIGELYGPDKVFFPIDTNSALERFIESEIPQGNISLAQHLTTQENVDYLKRVGYRVISFTVNSSAEALDVLRMGCDGFVSENIDLLNVYAARL